MPNIEIVLSKNDFEILKDYAIYSSSRTLVCEFNDLSIETIRQRYGDILSKYFSEKEVENFSSIEIKKPLVKLAKKKIIIENPTYEILSYLDVRSIQSPEVKIANISSLFILISQKIIDVDDSFSSFMTKMDLNSDVSMLFSSTGGVNFRGKLWKISNEMANMKISDFHFDEAVKIVNRYKVFSGLKVKSFDESKKEVQLLDEERDQLYKGKFFYLTPVMKIMLKKDRKLNFIAKKVYGDSEEGYTLVEPEIVPEGYKSETIIKLKSPRSIPTLLYNAAYSEYIYRSNLEV